MNSMYNDAQERISTEMDTKKRDNYYFAVRTKNKSGITPWKVYMTTFIVRGSNNSMLHGEFLNSSWFKLQNPNECECAIVKITTRTDDTVSRNKSTINILTQVTRKMNETNTIFDTDTIEMVHNIDERFFEDMTHLLKTQMHRNNSEFATIHTTMDNEKGVFGMSFSMRKGEKPCMYCPNFTLTRG